MENIKIVKLEYITHLGSPTDPAGYVEILPKGYDRIRKKKQESSKTKSKMTVRSPSVTSSSASADSGPKVATTAEPWWILTYPSYAFSDVVIKRTLGKIMATNVVNVFDPSYWNKFKEIIRTDFRQEQEKRIENRRVEHEAMEKQLLIKYKPNEISKMIKDHPISKVSKLANAIIKRQNLQVKPRNIINIYKSKKPLNHQKLYQTSTKINESAVQKGASALSLDSFQWADRNEGEVDSQRGSELNINPPGLTLPEEKYKSQKYEHPLLKNMRDAKNLEELYEIAEKITNIQILREHE